MTWNAINANIIGGKVKDVSHWVPISFQLVLVNEVFIINRVNHLLHRYMLKKKKKILYFGYNIENNLMKKEKLIIWI